MFIINRFIRIIYLSFIIYFEIQSIWPFAFVAYGLYILQSKNFLNDFVFVLNFGMQLFIGKTKWSITSYQSRFIVWKLHYLFIWIAKLMISFNILMFK